jgi:hypothetical protein
MKMIALSLMIRVAANIKVKRETEGSTPSV